MRYCDNTIQYYYHMSRAILTYIRLGNAEWSKWSGHSGDGDDSNGDQLIGR